MNSGTLLTQVTELELQILHLLNGEFEEDEELWLQLEEMIDEAEMEVFDYMN